jgi:DNA-binding response OmpR family regulator
MRVLIVEDEPLIAASIEWELRDRGHEVVGPAASAAHAWELARSAAPDLALVDINLMQRGEGVRVARVLRRRGVASVFVTGQISEARENRDVALGLVAKPFPVESLDAVVRTAAAVIAGARPAARPSCLELFAPFPVEARRPERRALVGVT